MSQRVAMFHAALSRKHNTSAECNDLAFHTFLELQVYPILVTFVFV